jgi:hypothetical protein
MWDGASRATSDAAWIRMGDWTKEKMFEPRTREVARCEAERISNEHSYGDTSASRANRNAEKETLFRPEAVFYYLTGTLVGDPFRPDSLTLSA